MHRRINALERMDATPEDRVRIEAILKPDYTSSDESEYSEDEDGTLALFGYKTKRLPWEKISLTKVKKSLDDEYVESLPLRSRRGLLPRRVHSVPSSSQLPLNAPSWPFYTKELGTRLIFLIILYL